MIEGRRLGIRFQSGLLAYYDIDPDGKVYWLRVRNGDKVQRVAVKEEAFAEYIRQQATKAAHKDDGSIPPPALSEPE